MKDKSNCEERFWAGSHGMQMGREWEPSFLAQTRDKPLFGLSKILARRFCQHVFFPPSFHYLVQSFPLEYL